MLVYVATKNEGKLIELRELTAGSELHLVTDEGYVEVAEGDFSYADNAALKARSLAATLRSRGVQAAVLADDSGLEISALDGRPGVISARYGGDMTWSARRALLMSELGHNADRSARFVCYLHFIDEHGNEKAVSAEVKGEIISADRGDRGFSYDPMFFYPPLQRTFAELRVREKNAVSHRARAVAKLLTLLDDSGDEIQVQPQRDERETHAGRS